MELKLIEESEQVMRLALIGGIDAKQVQTFEQDFWGLSAAKGRTTIVDLSGITYIASLGIGMLLRAAKELKNKGAKLIIFNPHPIVESLIAASRLQEFLPIVRDEAAAVKAVGI